MVKRYKSGVATSRLKRGKTRAIVNASLYRANRKLDLNGNGIVCDAEDVRLGKKWAALTYTGVGAFVQEIAVPDGQPAVVTLSHRGESNFSVWSLDRDLEQLDLLVNQIGDYEGTVLLSRGYSFSPTSAKHLEIDADGAWTITVAPISDAPAFPSVSSGAGDSVLRYGGKRTSVSLAHDGESNFVVTTYNSKGFYGDLLANEIGEYSGRVVLPAAALIVITADGNWSISK